MVENNLYLEDGVYTALVTPFTEDYSIDLDSLTNLLNIQYLSNVKGIVLLGTTGESPTLSENEKILLVKFVYEYNLSKSNKKKLIVGIGGNNTYNVLKFCNKIKDYVDYFMATVPYYNKPQQRGLIKHFKLIADEYSDKGIILYNIPGRTAIDMLPETIFELVNQCENIVGLKESSGNLDNIVNLNDKLKTIPDRNFKIYCGDDLNVDKYISRFNCKGLISVASNIIPDIISDIVSDLFKENLNESKLIFNSISDSKIKLECIDNFLRKLFIETNPVPIKYILSKNEIIYTDVVRGPLIELEVENQELLEKSFLNIRENIENKTNAYNC